MRTQHPWTYDWNAAPVFDAVAAAPLTQALRAELAQLGVLAHSVTWPYSRNTSPTSSSSSRGSGALRSRRMFGGVGLYSDELFFGLIDDDTLFFKTDDSNIARYRARNMPRFMPFPGPARSGSIGYHQVPADVIEDAETLVEWARKSVAVALASQATKSKAKSKAKAKATGRCGETKEGGQRSARRRR